MNTNRIRFIDQNESAYLPGNQSTIIGFTVIKAPKGTKVPVKFPVGSEQAIKTIFGTPSEIYPDIQEAIEFNREFSLYVSAPEGVEDGISNYYGGIYITTTGSIEKFLNVTDPEAPNFNIEVLGGNTNSEYSESSVKSPYAAQTIVIDTITNSVFDITKISNIYVKYPSISDPEIEESIKLKIGTGNTIVTDDLDENDVGDIIDNGDGTSKIVLVGNPLVANFDLTAAGDLDTYLSDVDNYAQLDITWIYNIEDDVVQTFYQSSPRSSQTTFSIKEIDLSTLVGDPPVNNPYYNTLTMSFSESNDFTSSNYVMSTDINAVDGYNASLYYENVLDTKAKWYIGSKVYKQYTDIIGTPALPKVITVKGSRIIEGQTLEEDLAPSLIEGWNELYDPQYEDVHIAFDNTGYNDIKTQFSSLRTTLLKMTTFLSPCKVGSNDTETAVDLLEALRPTIPVVQGGLGYTCNEFLIRDSSGKEYWSSIIGSVAINYARIMYNKLGGAAPMFTNDNLNLGGQLSRTVKKQKYKFIPDHLDKLYSIGINPIIIDSYYGLMLTSQKTASSPAFLTDWSFFGHSMAFDLLKREIKRDVLIPQLGKAINQYYLELRQSQVQTIVNKRLTGNSAIWDSAIVLVNDPEVNNAETKMQNKFVVKIRVKVNPFTEYIDFILNNVGQTTNL